MAVLRTALSGGHGRKWMIKPPLNPLKPALGGLGVIKPLLLLLKWVMKPPPGVITPAIGPKWPNAVAGWATVLAVLVVVASMFRWFSGGTAVAYGAVAGVDEDQH